MPAKVAANRETIFDLHHQALEWLEDVHRPQVSLPRSSISCCCRRFSSAAWSTPAPSSTTRRALFLDKTATQNQHLSRASLIAHETAHMWFGDLVTMKWFDDVWLKEVFANFMAAKIVEPVVSRHRSRAALLPAALSAGLRRRPHGGRQSDSAEARQSEGRRQPVRADHLPEGADRHAAARADARARRAARRAARVPHPLRVLERHVERPHRDSRSPHRAKTSRHGAAPGSTSPDGRLSRRTSRLRTARSRGSRSRSRIRAGRSLAVDPAAPASRSVTRTARASPR